MSSEKQVTTKKTNLPSAGLFEADAQKGFENGRQKVWLHLS